MAKGHHCPCCQGQSVVLEDLCQCRQCHHRWSPVDPQEVQSRYMDQVDRNALPNNYLELKLAERLAALSPYLADGQRVIEIGCAEGAMGALIKSQHSLTYTGIEISRDAEVASQSLDYVCTDASDLEAASYDVLLAFHVLEHIADINQALAAWRKLLTPDATMILEVPNQAGHPWLTQDANREHVHQFNVASLTVLLRCHGFEVLRLETGRFESPCYPDSIRVIAKLDRTARERRAALVKSVKALISEPFDVFAIGGDFENYLLPILGNLPVVCLFDNRASDDRHSGKPIKSFSIASNASRPILISSVRYEAEIAKELIAAGVAADKLVCLSEVLRVQEDG